MLIRPAVPADALAVARVHVRAWQVGYRGLLPDEYLDALSAEQRAQRYTFGRRDPGLPTTLVAVVGDATVGFVGFSASRDADLPDHGELRALYVEPDSWRGGVGKRLIAAACDGLVGAGHPRALAWVMEGNARAQRFYEADGWTPDGARKTEQLHGATTHAIRYVRALP